MIHRRLWCMHNAWQLNLYQFCKKKGEKIENPWSENESADSLTCRNCVQRDNDRGFLVQNQDVQQDGQSDRYCQQDAGILLVSRARWGRQECELQGRTHRVCRVGHRIPWGPPVIEIGRNFQCKKNKKRKRSALWLPSWTLGSAISLAPSRRGLRGRSNCWAALWHISNSRSRTRRTGEAEKTTRRESWRRQRPTAIRGIPWPRVRDDLLLPSSFRATPRQERRSREPATIPRGGDDDLLGSSGRRARSRTPASS